LLVLGYNANVLVTVRPPDGVVDVYKMRGGGGGGAVVVVVVVMLMVVVRSCWWRVGGEASTRKGSSAERRAWMTSGREREARKTDGWS
jgi:hypothetical protein